MNAKYSALYSGTSLGSYHEDISSMLNVGVKIFWFGSESDCILLRKEYPDFCSSLLLQCFVCSSPPLCIIKDGEIGSNGKCLEQLSEMVPKFNYEQYVIEHSSSEHLVVKASAGTGKTSVMIDRVLFLLHTVPDLKPSEISMITFTNDAADQMNQRLQNALLTRYNLTSNPYYLTLLENQSQMNISTFHSFAYSLLKRVGLSKGYTKDLSIRSFKHELDVIISDILNELIDSTKPVSEQTIVPLYIAKKTIYDFWYKLVEIGYSQKDLRSLMWGRCKDCRSQNFQNILVESIPRIDEQYGMLKNKLNSVSLVDMLRDLDNILDQNEINTHTINLKYLFVDEFQDSDNSQINVVVKLASLLKLSLFVVGDIKQSIYRFRGADDTAFVTFFSKMEEYHCVKPTEYRLVNNYRTAPEILNKLHPVFKSLGCQNLLEYGGASIPCHEIEGTMIIKEFNQYKDTSTQLALDLKESLSELHFHMDSENPKQSDKVVVLSRTNEMLTLVSQVCKSNNIPVVVKQDGSFYISDAVRDFYSMISSFLYHDALHLFNYLISPYSSLSDSLNLDDIKNHTKSIPSNILDEYINKTTWRRYNDDIHHLPFLTVIKKIVDSEPIIHNYASIMKSNYLEKGMSVEAADKQTYADCRQYKADLNKLLEVVQQRTSSTKCNLYDIYSYLQVMINTNRSEPCAEIDNDFDSTYVYCMTVHKAKGLEFDTVFIPFTNNSFRIHEKSQILVNESSLEVGWKLYFNEYKMMNQFYSHIHKDEVLNVYAEECRILYVALTRAIRKLIVYTEQDYKNNTWADILDKGGVLK